MANDARELDEEDAPLITAPKPKPEVAPLAISGAENIAPPSTTRQRMRGQQNEGSIPIRIPTGGNGFYDSRGARSQWEAPPLEYSDNEKAARTAAMQPMSREVVKPTPDPVTGNPRANTPTDTQGVPAAPAVDDGITIIRGNFNGTGNSGVGGGFDVSYARDAGPGRAWEEGPAPPSVFMRDKMREAVDKAGTGDGFVASTYLPTEAQRELDRNYSKLAVDNRNNVQGNANDRAQIELNKIDKVDVVDELGNVTGSKYVNIETGYEAKVPKGVIDELTRLDPTLGWEKPLADGERWAHVLSEWRRMAGGK